MDQEKKSNGGTVVHVSYPNNINPCRTAWVSFLSCMLLIGYSAHFIHCQILCILTTYPKLAGLAFSTTPRHFTEIVFG